MANLRRGAQPDYDVEPTAQDCDPSTYRYKDSKTSITIGSATNVVHHGSLTVINKSSKPKKSSKSRKPQKPLTESTEKLSIDQRMELKSRLGRDWRDLGRYLGMDEAQLDQMEIQYPNLEERNYRLLLSWEQDKDDEATCAQLANILATKLKRGDLADLLADS